MMIMITGGARSGKSTFAEKMCTDTGKSVGYIATAVMTDDDMGDRIARHKAQRPQTWITFERYADFEKLVSDVRFKACDVFLLDCITTMITNHMMDSSLCFETCVSGDVQRLEDKIKGQLECLLNLMQDEGKMLIIVTNEVGQGIVPEYRMGRIFRDIAGRVNICIADKADEVYMAVSGQSLRLK